MPSAERTEIFDVKREALYDVITDFSSTADFIDGVSSVTVLSQNETSARVQYSLNLIKKFSYILKLELDRPNKVIWKFEEGDLMKSNSGSWDLEEMEGGKTKVTYKIDIEFKLFAPKSIVKRLVEGNLPNMMKSYGERAKLREN